MLPQRQLPVSESLKEDRSWRFGSPVRCDIFSLLRRVERFERLEIFDGRAVKRIFIECSVFEMMLYSKHNRFYIRIPAAIAATPA
jgi:hypothetical protein